MWQTRKFVLSDNRIHVLSVPQRNIFVSAHRAQPIQFHDKVFTFPGTAHSGVIWRGRRQSLITRNSGIQVRLGIQTIVPGGHGTHKMFSINCSTQKIVPGDRQETESAPDMRTTMWDIQPIGRACSVLHR